MRFHLILVILISAVSLFFLAPRINGTTPVVTLVHNFIRPYLPITSPETLYLKVNAYRASLNLPPFSQESSVCAPVYGGNVQPANLFAQCAACTHVTWLSITKYADANTLLSQLISDNSAKNTLESPTLTHACFNETENMLTLFFATKNNTPSTSHPIAPVASQIPNPTHFTEAQLWQALSQYRQSQGRSNLSLDENLCLYARKRLSDHINLLNSKTPAEYPNPDKYPLDAHTGFSTDANTGYAFEVTKKNQLAENLAYWPAAQSPVHIIEWGWDSSTEGHREAQLSNDWTSACLSGDQGFYVAIFGK